MYTNLKDKFIKIRKENLLVLISSKNINILYEEDKIVLKEKIKPHEKDYRNVIVNAFKNYLWEEGKAENTIDNYCRTADKFVTFSKVSTADEVRMLSKTVVRNFISHLKDEPYEDDKKYTVESVNNKIAGINQMFAFYGVEELKVKALYCQRKTFIEDDEILTDENVRSLLRESRKDNKVLYYALEAMSQMGIRVSETKFINVESLNRGYIEVLNKGSARKLPLPTDLLKELRTYCEENSITSGSIISIRNGIAVSRSTIGKLMKKLAEKLGISIKKAHPHSIRHNFAIRYLKKYGYGALSSLADILGHRSLETTRVYLRDTLANAAKSLTAMKLK